MPYGFSAVVSENQIVHVHFLLTVPADKTLGLAVPEVQEMRITTISVHIYTFTISR